MISRTAAPLVLAALLATGLVACSPAADPKPDTSEEAPAEEEAEETPEANSDFTAAEWAKPVTNPGELLTTVKGTNFQVDVYQVGTEKASKTGQFVNPDDNKPIIAVGAEIVYVNYVVTNTSDEEIPLTYSVVDVSARYADWPYLQGMDSVVDSAAFEAMKVNSSAIAPNKGEAPFAWAPDTSFSYGQNFLYQAGSPITFTVALIPSLENGDLDHDAKQEIKVDTKIT